MPDNDAPQRLADKATAIAATLDSIATRGAARTWLAAVIRLMALWYAFPALLRLPKDLFDMLQRFLYTLNDQNRAQDWYTQMDMYGNAWENGIGGLVLVIAWIVVACRAGRIAVWVFPLKRHCLKCGYTIGRVSKTTPATPCPECGEGSSESPAASPAP